MRVIQPPNEVRVDSFVKRKIMVGLQSVLITYNYRLILSRNLYSGNDTIYSGSLRIIKLHVTCQNRQSPNFVNTFRISQNFRWYQNL